MRQFTFDVCLKCIIQYFRLGGLGIMLLHVRFHPCAYPIRTPRGELSYLAPLGSEKISAPYFKQCFFRGGGGYYPQAQSNTTPPSSKTEVTNILYIELCINNKI
jgi:hypothetical protein